MELPSNPNLLKSKFTESFLRSLLKITRETPNCDIFERCDRVKIAADKSLASAVGSRRAWSRAILSNIRNHSRRRRKYWWRLRLCRKTLLKRSCCYHKGIKRAASNFDEGEKLRKVVPGGEAMDLCSLLDEAAHYVMCLNTQVQVMRCIADFCSTTTTTTT